MNRTPSGIQRRRRLEEAIIPVSHGPYNSATEQLFESPQFPYPGSRSAVYLDPLEFPPSETTHRALLNRFLELYKPHSPVGGTGATCQWLQEACSLMNPGAALHASLHALAANRIAKYLGDSALEAMGRAYYGAALQKLNDFLGQLNQSNDIEILAAARCLMIYEVRKSHYIVTYIWSRLTVLRINDKVSQRLE